MTSTSDTPVGRDDRLRWFVGSLNRVVTTAAESNAVFGLMEQWAPEGFSPPLHVHHREDSAVILVDGAMVVRRGHEDVEARPGDCVFLPRDVAHTFVVTSPQAHFYELVTPGGFEQYHIDASDPAGEARLPDPGPPDIDRLVAALGPYGAEIIGPPMQLDPRRTV